MLYGKTSKGDEDYMKIKRLLLTIMICFFLTMPVLAATNDTSNVNSETFENGFSSYWYRAMNNYAYSGNPSTNYSVSPTHSYRFELHSTDPKVEGGKRAELEGAPEPPLQNRIYNFSTYLPNGGSEDYALDKPECDEIIAQWHQNPDPEDKETSCGPPLCLILNTDPKDGRGYYSVMQLWDSRAITPSNNLGNNRTYFDLGSYEGDKGKWVNWSFHVKWGWLASQNPKLEVYKDGVLVVNSNSPNTFNDKKGVNQQFGIYKWEWDGSDSRAISMLTKRVIYFDDMTVTQITGNLTDPVNPAQPKAEIKPVASFTATPTSGKYPLKVTFKDTSTGNITSRTLTFGDRYSTTTTNTTHTYNSRGTYTAKLVVTNSAGDSSTTKTITVRRY